MEGQAEPASIDADASGHLWRYVALLWLIGVALRLTILAVPPVLPTIHHDLHLDETLIGALTSLPVLLLAIASVPGAFLIARVGARGAIVTGLVAVALTGALRGIGASVPVLFGMSFLMGIGIAVSQPTLPTLVRHWTPARVALGTAAFSNGLLVGEILAAGLTGPLILPLVRGSWPLAFAFWSLPVALTALAVLAFTSPVRHTLEAPTLRWWPDWTHPLTWRLGLVFGCAAAMYFGGNAFIPDYLKATHHTALITAALTSLNTSQLPGSLIVGAFPQPFIGRRWPLVFSGVLGAISSLGLAMGGDWVIVWAGLLGASSSTVFILVLALPPLLAPEHDVHRLSAGIFTFTYLCGFVGSILGGAVWDLTGVPISAFFPITVAGIAMIVLVAGLEISVRHGHDVHDNSGKTGA